MDRPLMLWLDCVSSIRDLTPRQVCSELAEILVLTDPSAALAEIQRLQPRLICFEFDYPNQAQLRILQSVKRAHPGIPMLMLTVEHSEALAVWAFRMRVWNYLVKPVSREELRENLLALIDALNAGHGPGRAVPPPEPGMPEGIPLRQTADPRTALMPAVRYIDRHFNERICAEEMAQLCGLSRYQFSRSFHRAFSITFQEYLLRYRIVQACRLLRRPKASVTRVGYTVGFNDCSYFARLFKRYVGMLPSEYSSGSAAVTTRVQPDIFVMRAGAHAGLQAANAEDGPGRAARSPIALARTVI